MLMTTNICDAIYYLANDEQTLSRQLMKQMDSHLKILFPPSRFMNYVTTFVRDTSVV